jgi:hypothetical protein
MINGLAKRQGDTEKERHGDAGQPSPVLHVSPAPLLIAILLVLFFGPLAAPLFQATQLPLVADSGALARDLLARYICPTPAKSYIVLGYPMAVCARCWGATIGLWLAWLLIGRTASDHRPMKIGWSFVIRHSSFVTHILGAYLALAWPARLLLGAVPFLLWVAEISWWPAAPYAMLLLNGAFAGLWAGLFFCSTWLGLLHNRG